MNAEHNNILEYFNILDIDEINKHNIINESTSHGQCFY